MVGQTRILEKIFSYTLEDFPKTALFIGEAGCGKHTLVKEIVNKFNLNIIEITKETTEEDLILYKTSGVNAFYLINLSSFSEKQQNQFLKLIEEPNKNMNLVLLANSYSSVLETILNRCVIFQFEDYTEAQLKQIAYYSNEIIYKVCKTPGALLSVNEQQVVEIKALCETIINKACMASFANMLSLITKFNFGEFYDKYDINIFLNMLQYCSFYDFIETQKETSYSIFMLAKETNNCIKNNFINKELLITNFLIKLYNETR